MTIDEVISEVRRMVAEAESESAYRDPAKLALRRLAGAVDLLTGAVAYLLVPDPSSQRINTGMTTREHFAALALQGLLSDGWNDVTEAAREAVRASDELIIALNAPKQDAASESK